MDSWKIALEKLRLPNAAALEARNVVLEAFHENDSVE
jgi:hypothetical protein